MQTYQIAFKFQFQQDFTNQQVLIQISDSNTFLINGSESAQLQPYQDISTPPLSNFSVGSQQLFFNIASGGAQRGMQSVAWASFTNGGGDETLNLNFQAPGGIINVYYSVLGTSSNGQLRTGPNVISVAQ